MDSVPTDGKLDPREVELISGLLTSGEAATLAALHGLAPAQWNFRANAQTWTLAEIVEHLALVEGGLLRSIERLLAQPATPERRAEVLVDYDAILRRVPDRTVRLEAPERVRPAGKFPDGPSALATFASQREAALGLLGRNLALHHYFGSHPTLGPLDAAQLLVFLVAHAERHLAQVAEVKASPDFPG
jgi:hypothetical protein